MDDTVPLHPIALRDWETQLVPQVRQVELLGEISITADKCAQLGKVIGLQVRTLGHNQGLRTLRREYPCALAVYLVAQGVYGYQGGDYWSEVVQVTGLRSGYTWQVGQAFEEILEDLDLPLFYDMRAEAHRYVSLILAHGGIPDYCLPDFFANMLQPSVIRAQYAGMSATELIDEWQWRSSIQYFTDKPVLRFLAYGGRVAEDFVDRCREMAWETLDSGLVPDAEAVGLPGRVVDAYRRWIAEQDADQVQREATDRWRLRKPEVLVDPWGEGVILDLPPQQVPATMIHADVVWQIAAGGESHEVPVHVRKTGFDWKTAAESFPLSQPASTYEISLLTDGQVKRTWRYEGPSDERPILVFDAERGTLLPWKHSLPARCLGLLYPAQLDLRVEGKANLLEELPRLPWGWADFRGQTWDLGGAGRLTLLRGDDAVLIAPLRPDESAQRPHLVGGELLSPEKPGLRAPVYVGSPPCIRIPLVGRRDTGEELSRWRLTVRDKWPAVPEAQVTQTLADLRPELAFSDRYVDLPLGVSRLLGEAPFGNYLVRLRGPLGRDAEFTLRVVPHLVLCGHETLYLPDAQAGPQAVTLLAETAPGDSLECQEESGDCRVRETERRSDGWEYEIVVGPEITEVELTVARPLPSGDAARVTVLVSIHRLRWALAGEQAGPTRREWTGRTIKRSVDELLQTRSPYLLVALPLVEANQVRLALRLLDIDGTELQIANQASMSRGQRLWLFDLTAFLDTVRASSSPILRFELGLWDLPGRDEPLRLPVLSLTRTLIVEDVELIPHRAGDRAVFELRWREEVPLRNRHVRFWPLWRPWDPVFEQSIPDTAEGAWAFDAPPGELRSGKYRLEFLVVDPWVSPIMPQRPPKGTPGTVDVELISLEKQVRSLNARLQEKGECFELLLERAAVYHDTDDPQTAQSDWQWCFEHLDGGTIPQIIALVEMVRASGDQAMLRACQLKMFALGRVKRLLRAHRQGDISSEHFQAYLANLPRSGLLPQATCERLLSVEDERVRLHALQQLIRRSVVLGMDTLLGWVEAARLSDADAIEVLSLNPNFAIEHLQKQSDRLAADRLLKELGQTVEEVVRVGDWVHCNLGWGRIERIEKRDTQAQVNWCAGTRSPYRLIVALRPGVATEMIAIDLASRTAEFLGSGRAFTCPKCDMFSTQCKDLLRKHIKVAHPPRTKREAKQRGKDYIVYRFEKETSIQADLLELASEGPSDQMA